MPGHSQRRQRKRERSLSHRADTLDRKAKRRKKSVRKPRRSMQRVSKLIRRAFENAGNMSALRSPSEKTREGAYRVLKVELMRLEDTTRFRFFILEDFSVMLFTVGDMETREVHVYTHTDGVIRKS